MLQIVSAALLEKYGLHLGSIAVGSAGLLHAWTLYDLLKAEDVACSEQR